MKRRQPECQNFLHFENRSLVAGHIYARITVGGLGLHFTCRFASHVSKMHVACQITDFVEKPASSLHGKPCPPAWKAHCSALANLGRGQFRILSSIKLTRD
jgi:hypothetical protein